MNEKISGRSVIPAMRDIRRGRDTAAAGRPPNRSEIRDRLGALPEPIRRVDDEDDDDRPPGGLLVLLAALVLAWLTLAVWYVAQ